MALAAVQRSGMYDGRRRGWRCWSTRCKSDYKVQSSRIVIWCSAKVVCKAHEMENGMQNTECIEIVSFDSG
jgi:polyferredoxin